MCNAHNHGGNCTCGFGGDGHLGCGNLGGGISRVRPPVITFGKLEFYKSYTSYVNPNAKCPVCDASVFFYQSPYGGRVFFDELGPPWPKHPCTDQHHAGESPKFWPTKSIQLPEDKTMQWLKDGWFPANLSHSTSIPNRPLVRRCRVRYFVDPVIIPRILDPVYFDANFYFKNCGPFYLRLVNDCIIINTVLVKSSLESKEYEFEIFTDISKAEVYVKNFNSSSIPIFNKSVGIPSIREQEQRTPTAMEIAFSRAKFSGSKTRP